MSVEPIGVSGQDAKPIARPVISLEVAIDDEVMVRIAAVNDGTGTREVGHYDIDFSVKSVRRDRPDDPARMTHLFAVRIEDFARGSSVLNMMHAATEILLGLLDEQQKENLHPGIDHVYGGAVPAYVSIAEARKRMRVVAAKVGVAMAMEPGGNAAEVGR